MVSYTRHLIKKGSTIKQALAQLNELAVDSILFVVDTDNILQGSLTDGDVRRGFLRELTFENKVEDFIQSNPKYITKENYSLEQVIEYREKNFRIVPVVDAAKRVVNIINFRFFKSYLPLDAVIMAGGRGERLRPLTDTLPKPMLRVGDKPIIEHNIDRLASFGIDDMWLSVRYLAEKIEDHFKDGSEKGISIRYVYETEPLGTIGAVRKIMDFGHDYILVTNSDLLTNLDYEDFFVDFIRSNADLSVVTIPYAVKVPYAVLETDSNSVISFREKPTYTYYSNGGIYLLHRRVLDLIPQDTFFNATDLMEAILQKGGKVNSYPLRGYWLDVGNPEDFKKAQEDIIHLKL